MAQAAAAAGLEVCTAGRAGLPGSAAHQLLDLAGTTRPGWPRHRRGGPRRGGELRGGSPSATRTCWPAANVTGTYALVQGDAASPGQPSRLVHLGSAAEYGAASLAFRSPSRRRPGPRFVRGDQAGRHPAGRAGPGVRSAMPWCCGCSTQSAPGHRKSSLPGRAGRELRRALASGAEVRLGSLDAVRDFVDARDVADAVIAAAVRTCAASPGSSNIGSGAGCRRATLVRNSSRLPGAPPPFARTLPVFRLGRAHAGSRPTSRLPPPGPGLAAALTSATSLADLWEATGDCTFAGGMRLDSTAAGGTRLFPPGYRAPRLGGAGRTGRAGPAGHPQPGQRAGTRARRGVPSRTGTCCARPGWRDRVRGHQLWPRPRRDAIVELGYYLEWYGVAGVSSTRWLPPRSSQPFRRAGAGRPLLGARVVVFNHGMYPPEAYADHADVLGTFEGPWSSYRDVALPGWARSWPADDFYHVVHSVPRQHLGDTYELALRRRAGCAYVTDRSGGNPYDQLPADWPDPGGLNRGT